MEKVKRVGRAVARQAGVTLIEIMIVLAIIALIMGFLVGPRVIAYFKEAKRKTAWMMAKQYEEAYAKWEADGDNGGCPDKLEDLIKYMNKKDTKDPWGSTFVMKCGDTAPADAEAGFGVVSLGPDKKEGTDDDIRSWEKLK
jgi:general secretion pathway protein G